MRANISASRISIPHHLTTENPEPGRRIWGRGDLKLWFLATNNTLREPLRLWTDTLTWSELLHASFLSQHFICKNSLELNSYMQKGSEFEEANTWVGRDATSKKKEVASRKDNLQSMKDTSEGETSIELIFKDSLQLKKKKRSVSWLACKIRESESVLCHKKIQQRLLQRPFRPWRKTGLLIFHKPEYVDFMLQHIKLPFIGSTAPSSPNLGCR